MNRLHSYRFALQWWLTMALATLFFVSATLVVAHLLGGREGPPLFLWVLAVTLSGDVVVALCYEAIAPTRVVVTAGERERKDDLSREIGVAFDGFEESLIGRVRVRGELWRARHVAGPECRPRRGDQVRILARDGLILLVAQVTASS
jgi:membrane-bound ClpP family serine protease